jgi:Lon protease-like protein
VKEIPLFALNTVLFPDGALPLRIFETRYLDMVSRCLKEGQGFGVCLIKEGGETGPAKLHMAGTLAEIDDWSRGEDGLLNILARGTRRFRVGTLRSQADGLKFGEVEFFPDAAAVSLPEERHPLAELLRQILQQLKLMPQGAGYGDADWVGYRLAELLPISLQQRQYLLELRDAEKRLEILATLVQSLAVA